MGKQPQGDKEGITVGEQRGRHYRHWCDQHSSNAEPVVIVTSRSLLLKFVPTAGRPSNPSPPENVPQSGVAGVSVEGVLPWDEQVKAGEASSESVMS